MNTTAEIVLTSAAQAAAVLAPIDPRAAALVSLAPVAIQLLDTMTKMQSTDSLTLAEIEETFKLIGENVQRVHDQWAAMNVPK